MQLGAYRTPPCLNYLQFNGRLFFRLLSSFLFRLFVGLVATNGTTRSRTQQSVTANQMTTNAANCCALQAAFCFGSLRKDGEATH